MYCPNCRTNIDENAEICVNCGVNVLNFSEQKTTGNDDTANIWVNLISLCCFPFLGIIMYFVWKDQQPKAAKSALIFGIVGIGISIILAILGFFLGIAAGSLEESYY